MWLDPQLMNTTVGFKNKRKSSKGSQGVDCKEMCLLWEVSKQRELSHLLTNIS
jgi:hypothetical protein